MTTFRITTAATTTTTTTKVTKTITPTLIQIEAIMKAMPMTTFTVIFGGARDDDGKVFFSTKFERHEDHGSKP